MNTKVCRNKQRLQHFSGFSFNTEVTNSAVMTYPSISRDTHIILFLSPYYSIPVFLTFSPIILNIVSYYSQVNDLSKISHSKLESNVLAGTLEINSDTLTGICKARERYW